jgi:ribosome-binding protein aMBF1 (putative translation factor)
MGKAARTQDAVSILHGRYVKGDPDRQAALQRERFNAEVARLIYEARTAAGLSQQQLAELVGTTQSVISRLEDADYEGRSLSMLQRIADALDQTLTVAMTPRKTH